MRTDCRADGRVGWQLRAQKAKFKTPPIPDWVREIQHPQYRNVFSYALGNTNLWGTETLLGDWDGEYLLIAKDFYPAQYIEEGIEQGLENPYCHHPGARTNINLLKTLRHFGQFASTFDNANCNFLYVSACFLLRTDGLKRGDLPDEEVVLKLSAPVLVFTIESMPNLRRVVTMGDSAERALIAGEVGEQLRARKLSLDRVKHPSYAMSDAARFKEWEPVFAGFGAKV